MGLPSAWLWEVSASPMQGPLGDTSGWPGPCWVVWVLGGCVLWCHLASQHPEVCVSLGPPGFGARRTDWPRFPPRSHASVPSRPGPAHSAVYGLLGGRG